MPAVEDDHVLKLILNYDFDQPVPAVDRSPFANHGQVIQAAFAADGRETGSGALHFQQAGSAVRTAWRPVWQKIVALAIEAWIFVLPNGKRRNIIEGDGSFAFFLDADDTLVGSVFSLVDGAASPNWNIASRPARTVPTAYRSACPSIAGARSSSITTA